MKINSQGENFYNAKNDKRMAYICLSIMEKNWE